MNQKIISFINHLIQNRYLFYELVKRDILQKYRTSFFGVFWAIVEPITFMLLLAFIFDVGLRAGQMVEVPFVAYLITGMSVFFLFSGVLTQSANIIKNHAFLLNKVSFKLSILPLVNIGSQTVTHFFTLFPVLVILLFLGIDPNWYWLQAFYYLGALLFLLLGIVYLNSALGIFVPDINSITAILSRFLLYLSPVFWDISLFPKNIQIILKLNPMYYIISGYRDSFLFHKGFWNHPWLTIYFWAFSVAVFMIGTLIFKKMKPYFADYV